MDMQWDHDRDILRARIHRKVALAVLVVDDFTGKPITSPDVAVSAEELLERPVRKGDGYYLFMDYNGPALTVTAGGWAYHCQTVRVELSGLSPLRPVVRLRLTPNRNYAIPAHTTCLEGSAKQDSEIRVLCSNDPRPLRLLYDYTVADGRLIRLFDPADGDLAGRSFALLRKGETEPEYFSVGEKAEEEEGGYFLTAPLQADCKKAGASVFPVFTAKADRRGSFFLPLPVMAVREYQCRILVRTPDGALQEQEAKLEPGRVTRFDLTER